MSLARAQHLAAVLDALEGSAERAYGRIGAAVTDAESALAQLIHVTEQANAARDELRAILSETP